MFTAATPGQRRTVGWIGQTGKLMVTDRAGAVRDIDVIAVEHETGRSENGTCEYDADGKKVRAKRTVIDVELITMNLADGTVQKKPFPSSRHPANCPMYSVMDADDPKVEAGVPADTIKRWVNSLAEPAEQPATSTE